MRHKSLCVPINISFFCFRVRYYFYTMTLLTTNHGRWTATEPTIDDRRSRTLPAIECPGDGRAHTSSKRITRQLSARPAVSGRFGVGGEVSLYMYLSIILYTYIDSSAAIFNDRDDMFNSAYKDPQ